MALLLYSLFLLIAVFGRALMQYKLTGDYGIRLTTKKSSLITKLSSLLLVFAFFSCLSLSILQLFNLIVSQVELGVFGEIIGIVFCFTGILITVIAQYQMGVAWRIGVNENEKTELIIHGIFSLVRNPIYSGVILFGFGLLILVPHIFMLVSVLVGYLSIELQVRYTEEPYLTQLHGKKFKTYKATTNRYIPNIVKMLTRNIVLGD